jgi:single-strand DNA-binding protein
MSLNKVMLIGNVGNDPEVRYLESNPQNPATNAKVASFRLATTERYRDRSGELRENTEWHSIVVWRSNADVAEKFIRKGSQVYIEGKLRTRQWTDQTGAKRYTTEVVADTIQLLGKRPEGEQQQGGGYQGGYAGPGYTAPAAGPAPVAPAPVAPQPQVSPDYQGPLPAPESSDDLPF